MPHSLHFGRLAESYIERTTNLPSIALATWMSWWKYTSDSVTTPVIGYFGDTGESDAGYGAYLSTTWKSYNNAAEYAWSTQPTTGRWHHLAFTVSGASGNNYFTYLDGVLVATGACRAAGASQAMSFGSAGSITGYWANQQHAAIKVWNRVLTLAEIVAEIPFALPYNPAGLNSCYPMPTGWERVVWGIGGKTGSVSPYVDWSGNGDRIWTVSGTVDHDLGPPIG